MTARYELFATLTCPQWNKVANSHGVGEERAERLIDAYRAQVLAEAIESLRLAFMTAPLVGGQAQWAAPAIALIQQILPVAEKQAAPGCDCQGCRARGECLTRLNGGAS